MKKRNIFFLLLLLALLFIIGVFSNLLNDVSFEKETYSVVIKYIYETADYVPGIIDYYTGEHYEGEHISIVSPDLEGFKPELEVFEYTVTSDLYITIEYFCLEHIPDISLDRVITYPTKDTPGLMERYCKCHKGLYLEEFTSLTRTVTFGGEALKDMYFNAAGDVYNGYTYTGGEFVLLKNYAPELDCIFNGIDMSQENWADGLTVKIEYDGWNETVAFCQDHLADIPEIFKVRFGNDWRIILHYSPHAIGNLYKWLNSDSCPLRTSPLRITAIYDFTK